MCNLSQSILEEGKTEGMFETLFALVQKRLLTLKDAASQAGLTEATFRQKMTDMSNHDHDKISDQADVFQNP